MKEAQRRQAERNNRRRYGDHDGDGFGGSTGAASPANARQQLFSGQTKPVVDERSNEEIIRGMLATVDHAEAVGIKTVEQLQSQTHQMVAIHADLNDIDHSLAQSTYILDGMNGISGKIGNAFRSAPKVAHRDGLGVEYMESPSVIDGRLEFLTQAATSGLFGKSAKWTQVYCARIGDELMVYDTESDFKARSVPRRRIALGHAHSQVLENDPRCGKKQAHCFSVGDAIFATTSKESALQWAVRLNSSQQQQKSSLQQYDSMVASSSSGRSSNSGGVDRMALFMDSPPAGGNNATAAHMRDYSGMSASDVQAQFMASTAREDAALDVLAASLDRLKGLALEQSQEIQRGGKVLDVINDKMDHTKGKFQVAHRAIDRI